MALNKVEICGVNTPSSEAGGKGRAVGADFTGG